MAADQTRPRIALVHDALVNTGGAERAFAYMCEAFPEAQIFTSVYLPDRTYDAFAARAPLTLWGSSAARSERATKALLGLWILGFRSLDLSEYDVVLASTTFAAKYVRVRDTAVLACYCYAPFRWLWKPEAYLPGATQRATLVPVAHALGAPLRWFDRGATRRATRIATSSRFMVEEIRHCYQREAEVIPPPIKVDEYHLQAGPGEYYLSVSRLTPHKRVDLLIEACRRLGRALVVVGDGPDRDRLSGVADGSVRFEGRVSDARLRELYAGCRALLFASHEDYGLVPLEANASGRPVVAYRAGGAVETMIEDETAFFFDEQSVASLADGIERFERATVRPERIRELSRRYDLAEFKRKIRDFVLRA